MNPVLEHPLVAAYLSDFDAAASQLNEGRRLELREEIAGHLRESIPASSSNAHAAAVIAVFGSPAEILGQEPVSAHSDIASRKSKLSRNWGLAIAFGVAGLLAIVVLLWLFVPGGDAGNDDTGGEPLKAPTSVVNKTPTGPDRVQDGTAYFEYLAAIEAMSEPLPPGAEYPEGVPEGLDSGSTTTGVLQSGAGASVAHFTWLCAWEAEYLNAVDAENAQRQVAAESMLAQWPSLGPVDDPQEGWANNVLEPLSFGDRSGLQSDLPQTCAQAGILNVNAR